MLCEQCYISCCFRKGKRKNLNHRRFKMEIKALHPPRPSHHCSLPLKTLDSAYRLLPLIGTNACWNSQSVGRALRPVARTRVCLGKKQTKKQNPWKKNNKRKETNQHHHHRHHHPLSSPRPHFTYARVHSLYRPVYHL